MARKKAVRGKATGKAAGGKAGKATSASSGRSSAEAGLVAVGRPAPAIHLSQYRGQWVVLYFYPKDSTPGCTKQACQFRDTRHQFASADAVILGVSPDSVLSHTRFIEKFKLPFTLLADPEKKACRRYGVWRQKTLYGRKFMGVVRTTYLIDPNGKVAHRWDKVKVAGHEKEVLAKIGELSAE